MLNPNEKVSPRGCGVRTAGILVRCTDGIRDWIRAGALTSAARSAASVGPYCITLAQ